MTTYILQVCIDGYWHNYVSNVTGMNVEFVTLDSALTVAEDFSNHTDAKNWQVLDSHGNITKVV